MRYTRLEIQGSKNFGAKKVLIQFFVIIPILALFIGNLLTRYVIVPQISKNVLAQNNNAVPVFKMEKVYKFFYLQAGLYSKKDNANFLLNSMKQKGFAPAIVQDQQKYRVIVGYSSNSEKLNNVKEELKASGYNALINEINIQTLDKDGNQDLKSIKEYFSTIFGIINSETETLNASSGKEENGIKFEVPSSVVQDKYEGIMKLNIEKELKTDFDSFQTQFNKKLNDFAQNINSKDHELCNQDILEQLIMVHSLYKLISKLYAI